MKIQGTINLDVRDISTTFDYGQVVLNAGNKQISIRLTKEAAELLQHELYNVMPHTPHSIAYRNYRNIGLMKGDSENVQEALKALQEEGKISKDVTVDRMTTEECDLVNEWRTKYYEELHSKK